MPITGGQSFNDILSDLNGSSLGAFTTFSLSATGELISTPNTGYDYAKVHVKSDSTSRGATEKRSLNSSVLVIVISSMPRLILVSWQE